MKKFFLDFIVGIWLIVAIFTTVTLLSFNDYRVSEIGPYSMFVVDSDDLEPNFKAGDWVIQEKTDIANINSQDYIFFYNESSKMALVNLDSVSSKEIVNDSEATFLTASNKKVSSQYVIGKANDAKVIHNIGYALSVLQSKWGFMFIVIFPTIFLFVYEVFGIVNEYKKESKREEKVSRKLEDESSDDGKKDEEEKEKLKAELREEIKKELEEEKEVASESKEDSSSSDSTIESEKEEISDEEEKL